MFPDMVNIWVGFAFGECRLGGRTVAGYVGRKRVLDGIFVPCALDEVALII